MIWWRRKPRLSLGEQGEQLAAKALKRAGYKILERNAQLGRYEVDIIAREADTVAFVEVKTRRTGEPIRPEENVGWTKQRHIVNAADQWIRRHGDDKTYYRFDIVSVILPEDGPPEIEIIREAFRDEF